MPINEERKFKMKTIISIILLVALSASANAQHCEWDNTYAIILDVRDSLTNEIITDLDIILTDSTEKPYTSDWNLKNYTDYSIYQKTDTLKFGLNVNHGDSANTYTVPIAIDNYMLFVYGNNYPNFYKSGFFEGGNDKIKIQDKSGRYESITIDEFRIVHLCTNNQIWRNKKILKKASTTVKLKKRIAK
ncbi:hypothetical protein [Brumimicrobium aurantiacum]|uniref:Uncharacterized protein n=1 Tax=Brumimicrobium aurantiacum TaxID=1737063 RepID=A0A3E1F1H2_9FLAO|nr:hypothetical protein [Brumimicrobium aurantiacum]RFC55664.1 hypothetical protein DXU93_01650 [Brumimicrobium aurantiacum]